MHFPRAAPLAYTARSLEWGEGAAAPFARPPPGIGV